MYFFIFYFCNFYEFQFQFFESSCARDGGMWWIILHWGDHIWSFFRRGAGNCFTMSHTATRAASWPYMDVKVFVTSVPRGGDVSLYGIWAGSTHIWVPPSLHRFLGCIINHTLLLLDTKISEESIFRQVYSRFFYLFKKRTIYNYD